jgi:hypothetical protein
MPVQKNKIVVDFSCGVESIAQYLRNTMVLYVEVAPDQMKIYSLGQVFRSSRFQTFQGSFVGLLLLQTGQRHT